MIKTIVFACGAGLFLLGCDGVFSPGPQSAPVVPDTADLRDTVPLLSSKEPALIALESISFSRVSVTGVGGVETSVITFLVMDSAGTRVNGAYCIQFQKNGPDSGGVLVTLSDTTNNGHVTCVYKSGTAAGVCAINAEYRDANLAIRASSAIVPLLVSGGPPVGSNFTLIPEKVNIPLVIGTGIQVRALLFDAYGNPACPVMVYFSATGGGITEGGLSDSVGQVDALFLISENVPVDSKITITAVTRDASRQEISASSELVISGLPVLTLSHPGSPSDTIPVSAGGSAAVRVHVADANGYPLSCGTHIVMSVSGSAELLGETDITLPDVVSGYTDFEVRIRDAGMQYAYFNVAVTSPNGSRTTGLWAKIQ
ncbi:MAG: hypothetical protein A2268_12110 [Candidatus Raymondbacteria bacterium RifOxyA12_full_50_37]|uniref:Big-1 domain-containing protein n=1 Tax=Candidatus Raymondbacteria bacterium RIFOXYD12_FULL_49_13 TaxID=1817890 RepID=A0A1F7F0W4_UNCRA|nr:MAG: hypothetical protein A2268_12110 [Candidatus Raymondbacteria bacterium RifOxyA12_full_50_37]OGJ86061.1 MAG: hypothetical protein A2248_02105 [Candidatus Raymondbacteria bacterium RIFOXYA2_FULL_49_16]OGJ95958.1 MAG: hypothetical protein A2453_05510 [Candidatus Raymondbacteria bacterium RIFOXYC2_FULL_50_21]OGK00203.1 MAG: hypothetical protein A2519_20565 [Candidatus Raymondbacteria bacterium RIFOXYD12_FULL_49_13]OGK03785.1 MAG: hypothetical protein A2487_09075 [Candidatus Raymondbacteria 